MKKILMLNLGKHYGGAEKLIENLAYSSDDIYLALDVNGQFISKININNNRIIKCTTKKKESFKNIKNLIDYIKENNIEVIHSHGTPSNVIAIILKLFCNIKIITTIHSDLNYDFEGNKKKVYLLIEKFILKYFDEVVCVSEELRKKIKMRCKSINPKVIINGVLKSEYNEVEGEKNQEIVFLSIGRLTLVKNYTFLLEALNIISKEFKKFKCYIIGEGEERKRLELMIKEYNLGEQVFLLGFKDNINEYMRNSDMLLITSLMEGIPLVALEAFSNKLLVVSSEVGGMSEIIQNNYNGLLYKSNNLEELTSILKKYINNEINKEYIVNNAYNKYLNNFTDEVMCEKYFNLYK
ncbi:glycosyltransferase [uncultured Clostridium sp.]|uniref:glycosyltransferase n=1 Tax=uncultured Clostridium sp. TaxID=59620 RepID=UPI002582B808|nr:glycosyltransferase [uncultured Clostridium sp.]